MQTFTLERTGLPALKFQGEQIADSRGRRTNELTGGRYHDIQIFRTDDRRLVVAISYASPLDSEVSDHIVDEVSSLEDVDDVLSLYDPTERLDLDEFASAQCREAVECALTRAFDHQVIDVLSTCGMAENSLPT